MIPEFQHEFLLMLLIFARVSILISIGPFFMLKGTPRQVKAILSIFVSFVVLGQIDSSAIDAQFQFLSFVLAIMGEVVFGFYFGCCKQYTVCWNTNGWSFNWARPWGSQ